MFTRPHTSISEFDEQDFVSGVQLLTDNFSDILAGNGELNGLAVSNVCCGLIYAFVLIADTS